jgi:cytochrome c-type biogenesis protein CcmH/NrfG
MRGAISLYVDPELRSKADVWAGEESQSKKTSYIVLAVSLAVTSAMGYAVYQLVGMGKLGQSFGSLMLA